MGIRLATLTDDEFITLFTQAQAGDQQALSDAVEALDRLTQAICGRLHRNGRWTRTLDLDDLLQEGRLNVVLAIRRYRAETGIPPGAFVTFCVRRSVYDWADRTSGRHAPSVSLDQAMGDDDEAAGEWFPVGDQAEAVDLEMEALLDRIPPGASKSGGEHLAVRLHQGKLNTILPDDATLAKLVRSGKTMDELTELLGVNYQVIKKRLTLIRRSGTPVPVIRVERKGEAKHPMQMLPWAEKLRMIADYLDSHPGISNCQAAKDLHTTYPTLNRARAELVLMAG